MNQKYKATGIILKGSSIKENDRLVTVLTPEYGLIRAIAPGAKKLKSSLRGRTELFVVNELLIIKGRSLDKIIQADTQYTYPGLSRDIGKLAAAQYLAELTIFLAVDEQPQPELYELLNEHLRRLEKFTVGESVYPYLAQGVFHLIAIAGLSPQVFDCCLAQRVICPDLASAQWRVGFGFEAGGIVDLGVLKPGQNKKTSQRLLRHVRHECLGKPQATRTPKQTEPPLTVDEHDDESENYNSRLPKIDYRVNSLELFLLQQLNHHQLPPAAKFTTEQLNNFDLHTAWIRVEKILREYIQYHIGRTIRSANLVDNLYVEF